MNTERDKFLTEVISECWHEFPKNPNSTIKVYSDYYEKEVLVDSFICIHCKKIEISEDKISYNEATNNNFSTWEGFGKLFKWSMRQKWWTLNSPFWSGYTSYRSNGRFNVADGFINPDKFADTLYDFLRNIEKR